MTPATTVLLPSTANETIRNSVVTSSSPTHQKEALSRQDGCKAADDADENVTFNSDDDGSDEGGFDEEEDLCDDEEEEVAALLDLEVEEMMKLEED